jgi:hypothetical protein
MLGWIPPEGGLQKLPGMPCRARGSWLRTWLEGRARSRWPVGEFSSPAGRPCRSLRRLPGICSAHRATGSPPSRHGFCARGGAGHLELSPGQWWARIQACVPAACGRARRKRAREKTLGRPALPRWGLFGAFRARSRRAAAESSDSRWSRSLEVPTARGPPGRRQRPPAPPFDPEGLCVPAPATPNRQCNPIGISARIG